MPYVSGIVRKGVQLEIGGIHDIIAQQAMQAQKLWQIRGEHAVIGIQPAIEGRELDAAPLYRAAHLSLAALRHMMGVVARG
jgi:hypothetical protein